MKFLQSIDSSYLPSLLCFISEINPELDILWTQCQILTFKTHLETDFKVSVFFFFSVTFLKQLQKGI